MILDPHPLFAILGPTASGKSELSIKLCLKLAEEFGIECEIINCDSVQIYREMNIGTAKISKEEMCGIPHHLIDIVEPNESFSAGNFMEHGRRVIFEIRDRGKIPVLCGGTGFYFRSLVYGIFEGPEGDERIRDRLKHLCDRYGSKRLYRVLKKVDPIYSRKISENDRNRIIRALEVYFKEGKPISYFHNNFLPESIEGFKFFFYCLNPPRKMLYKKINDRVEKMFDNGLLDEVKSLLSRYPKNSKGFEAIGYREVIEFLDGNISLKDAINLVKKNTRHYAKRQLTWFRKEKDVRFLNFFGNENKALEEILEDFKGFYMKEGLTPSH